MKGYGPRVEGAGRAAVRTGGQRSADIITHETARELIKSAGRRLGVPSLHLTTLIATGLVQRWGTPAQRLVTRSSVVNLINSVIPEGRGSTPAGLPFGQQHWPLKSNRKMI